MPKAGIQFSKKDEWHTPKEVVNFFGPFDYDPATTKEQAEYLGIPNYDTIETDGLNQVWGYWSKIWVNPPFTKKFLFLDKAVRTMAAADPTICFLMPIESITTKAFHKIIGSCPYNMWVPNGRIKFDDGSGKNSSPAFGSVVLELDHRIKETRIIPWRLYDD